MDVDVKAVVRRKYGEAATRATAGAKGSCCGPSTSCGCGDTKADGTLDDPISRDLYDAVTTSSLPERAVLASLGCGNPTALAELREGEVVLDLGSGGGIDVLLSAKRVGPTGKAYGLDMTDEMLELARQNAEEAGAENVEFLKGDIEHVPLPDASVDVIISNCVINLATDKPRVFREALRVLKPGGRFAVSDMVVQGEMPPEVRRDSELWAGCVAGALEANEYERLLAEAGFEGPSVEPTRSYENELAKTVDGEIVSAFVRARKPKAPEPTR
jgi:arsenite methyltransferase